jgi:signal transduction histidine kinase
MLILYSLIIVVAFSIFSISILNNYKATQIKNTQIRLFQTANIVADTYKQNMDNIIFSRMILKNYAEQANARILILDTNKKVIMDSYYNYIDQTIDNKEIRNSLTGASSSSIYTLQDREILQIAVPITLNTGKDTRIIGAVLISSDLEPINENVDSLRDHISKIAILVLLISLALTVIATNNVTSSLRELTLAVEKISSGNLGYQIEKKSKDEIGNLIETFNNMSQTLKNIEKNRKNFINSISHELKTPLTSIKVLIESLSMGNHPIDTYKEYLEDIYGETERMERLVNYLMKSIKLEDSVLNLKEENLGTLLMDIVNLIKPYADKNKVSIILTHADDIIVKCDKDKVKEVIFNLIDNAIKYRDENKKSNYVKVSLKKDIGKGIITVEDNGIGINKENLQDIFKSGFRVLDGTLSNENMSKGFGIGLAIAKSFIDKHGWNISVDSTLGKGTTFTIDIPIES